MDADSVNQIVDEILESFEPLETQTAAVIQFLKVKGLATDEELAPFLEQAGNAANVRWRAVRVRTAALISNAFKTKEQDAASPAGMKPLSEQATEEGQETKQTTGRQNTGEPEKSDSTPDQPSKPEEGKEESQPAFTPTQEGTNTTEANSNDSESPNSSAPEAA